MSLGVYLKLDQKILYNANFSSGSKITGTIYSDESLSTAKNLTDYTLTLRMFRRGHYADYFNRVATITTAASGTWSYAVAQSEMPPEGLYLVILELTKSGDMISTLNDVEILIKQGPSS